MLLGRFVPWQSYTHRIIVLPPEMFDHKRCSRSWSSSNKDSIKKGKKGKKATDVCNPLPYYVSILMSSVIIC